MANIGDFINKDEAEVKDFDQMAQDAMQQEQAVAVAPHFAIPEWLKAETGEGAIEDYVQHPMNFNKSMSMARILRGLTGMFGSLRYAVIDVFLGALDLTKERKAKAAAVEVVPYGTTSGH